MSPRPEDVDHGAKRGAVVWSDAEDIPWIHLGRFERLSRETAWRAELTTSSLLSTLI